jgi:hypothetical protein
VFILFDSVGAKSEMNTVWEDFTISDIHTSASINGRLEFAVVIIQTALQISHHISL